MCVIDKAHTIVLCNHKKPEKVACCPHFIKRHLNHEKRMFRWMQLPLAQVKDMKENLEIDEGLGHRHTDSTTCQEMVEFHVDQHPSFQDGVATTEHGGNLSVMMPANIKTFDLLWTKRMHLQTICISAEGLDCSRLTEINDSERSGTWCHDVCLCITPVWIWALPFSGGP
jgi:hypothetical protein